MGLLTSLINGASDALFIAETETGIIVFANDAACRLMECEREDLIGIHQTKLHPIDDLDYVQQQFKEFGNNEDYKEVYTNIQTFAGKKKPVLITGSGTYEEDGKKYVSAFFKDQSLAIKLNEISFIHSHLIRAPLANILGLSKLLADNGMVADEERSELLIALYDNAEKLDTEIRNVINASYTK